MRPISNAIHRLEGDKPYLSQVLKIWDDLVAHAKNWLSELVEAHTPKCACFYCNCRTQLGLSVWRGVSFQLCVACCTSRRCGLCHCCKPVTLTDWSNRLAILCLFLLSITPKVKIPNPDSIRSGDLSHKVTPAVGPANPCQACRSHHALVKDSANKQRPTHKSRVARRSVASVAKFALKRQARSAPQAIAVSRATTPCHYTTRLSHGTLRGSRCKSGAWHCYLFQLYWLGFSIGSVSPLAQLVPTCHLPRSRHNSGFRHCHCHCLAAWHVSIYGVPGGRGVGVQDGPSQFSA
ncbi:hypothetical protein HaLaN_28045, partial [Haematococcus lacustris]